MSKKTSQVIEVCACGILAACLVAFMVLPIPVEACTVSECMAGCYAGYTECVESSCGPEPTYQDLEWEFCWAEATHTCELATEGCAQVCWGS